MSFSLTKLALVSLFLFSSSIAYSEDVPNLLTNSDFEAPEVIPPDTIEPGADGWETFNTAGVQTNIRHSFRQALRLAPSAPTGTADGIARQVYQIQDGDVAINTPYSFSAWIFNNDTEPLTGSRKLQMRIQWFNANDNLLNQVIQDVADASTPQEEWIFVSLENVLIPDNANIAEVRVGFFATNDGGTGGGPIYIDDATLVEGSTAFRGGNPRLLNPGFEFPDIMPPDNQAPGADDWTTFNTAGVRTILQNCGDQSLRLAPNAPTGTAHGICRQEFAVGTDIFVDQPYSMSAWVYNNSDDPISGARRGELRIQWLNENDVVLNQAILTAADANTPQDQWILASLDNIVIPQNVNITKVRVALFVVNGGGTGGGPVFFDDVNFRQGETSILLADVNRDGAVNLLDVVPFVELISSASFSPEGDVNQDCSVDLLDVGPFIEILSGG